MALVFSLLLSSVGCGILQPREDVPLEQKAVFIKNAAKSAVYFSLAEIYKHDASKMIEKATWMKAQLNDVVWPVLRNPNVTIDEGTEKLLFAKIPTEWALLMQNAFDVFRLYYRTPATGELLDPEQLTLLVAFFNGVDEGCVLVISTHEIAYLQGKVVGLDSGIQVIEAINEVLK